MSIGNKQFYFQNDLFERIYNCPKDSMVALSNHESNLLGTLLVDYLAIEEELKINKNEYEKSLSEFVSRTENESRFFVEEKNRLLKE
jgi:hypothetical protein